MDTSVVTEIKPKMHFNGKVTKTSLAGAFIDIGLETQGFLHVSQLVAPTEGQAIHRVEDVLQVGQMVDVWVRKVKEGRVELTMFKPLGLDWRDIKPGMAVKGTVTRLETFGAFVEIGAERPGLVHISEMAHGYVRKPSDVVNEGDEIEVQVLDVNRRKKQIKLSLKALLEPPAKEEPVQIIENVQKDKDTRRRRGGRRNEEPAMPEAAPAQVEAPAEPDPTAMEIAMRQAMEKARGRHGSLHGDRGKREKAYSHEQEDILSRTLENKVRTN
jgi:predicted RNA-binding protein with RPS1 domain